MGNILLLFLVLFPMLLSAWVFPLRRRDRRYRNWLIQIIPAVELAAALLLLLWPGAALELPGVFGFGLRLQAGSLGSLLALVSAFLWAATGLNCPSYFAAAEGCNRFYFFWLLTLGALMGVFLAADLFTLFVFFEMMSFTSYVWVVQNETEEARQAGQTYLAVAVIGGMALLAGYRLHRAEGETLEQYLHRRIFAGAVGSTVQPDARDSRGFAAFMKQYIRCLAVERAAIDALP